MFEPAIELLLHLSPLERIIYSLLLWAGIIYVVLSW